MGVFSMHDGHDKKERLYRWLGQQKSMFQAQSTPGPKTSNFVPLTSSGESSPTRKESSTSTPPSDVPRIAQSSNIQRYPMTYFSRYPIGNIRYQEAPRALSTSNILNPRRLENGRNHFRTLSTSNVLNPRGLEASKSLNTSKNNLLNENGCKSSNFSKSSSNSDNKNSSIVYLQPKIDYDPKEPFIFKQKGPNHQQSREIQSLPTILNVENLYTQRRIKYPPICPQFSHTLVPNRCVRQYRSHHNIQPNAYRHYGHHPSVFYRPVMQYPYIQPIPTTRRTVKRTDTKQERRKRKDTRKRKEKRKNKPLTDKQIEKSYTGLDREIAEGFISLSMEPALSQRKSSRTNSSENSESF